MCIFYHEISGLRVASDIKLDDRVVSAESDSGVVDVRIFVCSENELAQKSGASSCESDPIVVGHCDLLFHPVPGVRLRVTNGREIRVSWDSPHTEKDVLLFLFGSAWGILCHQRKLWPLHCSAIGYKQRSIAFTGVSGAGKSTLAAGLRNRGYEHICDDVCVVDYNDGTPVAWPVEKGIKLWNEAADFLNVDTGTKILSSYDMEKFYARQSDNSAKTMSANITLYVLNLSEDHSFHIEPLSGFDRFQELYRSTYRVEWIDCLRDKNEFFQQLHKISGSVNMYSFSRPRGYQFFDEGLDYLIAHFDKMLSDEDVTHAI